MRYLKNVETNDVVEVPETDEQKFQQLIAERLDNGRPRYVQTGAHDPAVTQVEVSGQDPANGDEPSYPGASSPVGRSAVVETTDDSPGKAGKPASEKS